MDTTPLHVPETPGQHSRLQAMAAMAASARARGLVLVTADGENVALVPIKTIESNAKPGHRPCNGRGIAGTFQGKNGRTAELLCRCTWKRLLRLTDAAIAGAAQASKEAGEPVEEAPEETDVHHLQPEPEGSSTGPAEGPGEGAAGEPDQSQP